MSKIIFKTKTEKEVAQILDRVCANIEENFPKPLQDKHASVSYRMGTAIHMFGEEYIDEYPAVMFNFSLSGESQYRLVFEKEKIEGLIHTLSERHTANILRGCILAPGVCDGLFDFPIRLSYSEFASELGLGRVASNITLEIH